MGNTQTQPSEESRYKLLKKLYAMNRQEMEQLKQQLIQERLNNQNTIMKHQQLIKNLQTDQTKIKNKLNSSGNSSNTSNQQFNVDSFLNSLDNSINQFQASVSQSQGQDIQNTIQKELNQLQLTTPKEVYLKKEEIYEREFRKEQQDRERMFREQQRQRRDEYEQQIKSFKSNVDPYRLLQLGKNYTLQQLKDSYKKLALITHPDRPGGSNEKFQIATKAYMTLLEELKKQESNKSHTDLRNESRNYFSNQQNQPKQNIKLDKDKFDIRMFNKIYDENKLYSIDDDGYEDWMKQNKYDSDDIKKNEVFSDRFNLNVFNSVFNKNIKNDRKEIVEYKEPQALNSGGNQCVVLGQDKVSNFSGSSSIGYTDYREAHTTQRLVNPNNVQRQNFNSLNEIKAARTNIPQATPADIQRMEQQKAMDRKKEEDRLLRLQQNDNRAFNNYSRIHDIMLDYQGK